VTHRPPHGNATIVGNKAAFKCFEGYKIRNAAHANLTCHGSAGEAKWDGTAPECDLACDRCEYHIVPTQIYILI
jgi:hypothetical protein